MRAEIDLTSVTTGHTQRDANVLKIGFFDVERFPTATFASAGVRAQGGHHMLDGDFTLKGITKPVSLTLEYFGVNPGMGEGEVAGFEASVALSCKHFGIVTDMPVETGPVIGDKVTITLDIEALKQT